jgi:hypothetical protein
MRNSGRSRLRERAIEALLREPTQEKAAQVTGIGLRTLQRWLTDPMFQEGLREAKSAALADATSRLRMVARRSVDVLDSIANNRRATYASRVSACRCILELGFESYLLEEVETRLRKLEQQTDEISVD